MYCQLPYQALLKKNLLILRAIVKTDKILRHKPCILWHLAVVVVFGVKFREDVNVDCTKFWCLVIEENIDAYYVVT